MGKTSKMKAALIVTAVWMFSCAVLQGADRGFDDIVRAISNQFHTQPLHIPFFGLVNFATFVAHPAGVKHLDLAVFENLDLDDHSAKDLAETIRSAGGSWRPFVRVRGHAQTVLVYMAEERGDCRLLVLTVENAQVTVVELKLNPEATQAWLREPDAAAARNVSR
jgi:hypothetical protein